MATKQEVETLKILGVNLDVYFSYHPDFGFEIDAIETLGDIQDIQHLLSEYIFDKVVEELTELYRTRGWL